MANITIRDVPDEAHAELVARAALAGQSLQEYLKQMLIEAARRPDANSFLARVRERKRASGSRLAAKRILEYRDAGRR